MPGVVSSPEERALRARKKREYRAKLKAGIITKDTRPAVPNGHGTGRPTIKTGLLCGEIVERVSRGETLKHVLEDARMPDYVNVCHWEQGDPSFASSLARARELGAKLMAEEVVAISDAELATHEEIGRARLRMQSRQWLAGKHNATYADKPGQTQINVGVNVVLPEAERVKLIERRDRALKAQQQPATNVQVNTLPYSGSN